MTEIIGASAIIVREDGKILLQHRDDKQGINYPGKWGLFGGHRDGKETLSECIKREVKEETGLDIEPELLDIHDWMRNGLSYNFLARTSIKNTPKINEGQEGKFFTLKEALRLDLIPEHRDCLRRYAKGFQK